MASHRDADHIGGLIHIVRTFPVGQFIHNGDTHNTETYADLATAVATHAIPTVVARDTMSQAWGCCATADMLHPVDTLGSGNDNSIVFKLSHGEVDVLFTGDIEAGAEESILERRGRDIQSEVLKVAHHGSDTSSTLGFIEFADPELAVVSTSDAHPVAQTVLDRLWQFSGRVLQTREVGDITILSTGDNYRVTTPRP